MKESGWAASKKLKRGLEDISPLFQPPSTQPSEVTASRLALFDIQFLAVCVPDHEGDAFLANAYLASQVVRRANLFASLVSIAPGFNVSVSKSLDPLPSLELLDSRISRVRLSHQELWTLTQTRASRNSSQGPKESRSPLVVFLEFEPAQFRSLARLALLLDRVVLYVQPEVESLREAYRLIKIFWSLNREIEFFLLFRGGFPSQAQEAFLFERFSLITSRFIGISSGWLGNLAFPDKNDRSRAASDGDAGFNPEPILSAEGLRRPLSPEKVRFRDELLKIFESRFSRGFISTTP